MESIVASDDRLHFFEYMEVDMLQEYIRAGLRFLANSLLDSHPLILPLRYYSAELATFLDVLKDLYSLVVHNATYAEGFFDFQRKTPLGRLAILKNILLWNILPYLAAKIELYYQNQVAQQIDGTAQPGTIKKIFLAVYPYLYAIWSVTQVLMSFIYLLKAEQKSYNLLYWLSREDLKHKMVGPQGVKYPVMELLKKPGLLAVLLAHKVINWYFTQKNSREGKIEAVLAKQQVTAPFQGEPSGVCPLCKQALREPTVVRTSGWVYCQQCIRGWVKRNGRCPRTQVPIGEDSLQTIYS